jgi:hypothetical protein
MNRYAVVTFLFNQYDLLREPLVIDENADYYCITDDNELESNYWKCIYIKNFDTDKLSGIQKTYMAKYSFYKLLPYKYDWYITIDAAIEVKNKLSPIIEIMENNNAHIGLSMHPDNKTWECEYNDWINNRNLDKKYYDIFKAYSIENGIKPTENTGLIECTVKIYKNNENVLKFIDDVYNTLNNTNNFEDKNDQCYLTCVFHKYDSILNSLFFYRQLYTKSIYFNSYYHKTNTIWQTNKTILTNTNELFGIKRELHDIGKEVNNIDIFIGTQKTFTPQVSNEIYKIIVGNHEITNNSNLQLIQCKHDSILDDRFYSELYMLDYVSKNVELKDYVGFCHNRRYFSFLDEIPNMEEIFDKYDAIVAEPITYKITIKEQYEMFHNIEDLYVIGGIIADKYPSYSNVWHNFINGNILIPYNMFIMRKDDFKEYINFIFSILDEYLNIVGTDINKRIYDNFEKYIKDFYPNNTVEYQYRIGGYISERLTNLFMMHKFKIMKTYPVIVTENKYITKEDSTK